LKDNRPGSHYQDFRSLALFRISKGDTEFQGKKLEFAGPYFEWRRDPVSVA
jgi:hypothetical protein